MRRLVVLLTIIILNVHVASACDCLSSGNFLTVASRSDLVTLVRITKYLSFKQIDGVDIPMSMEVEILKIFKGHKVRKKITVWGDNGFLCRPYLSDFVLGDYYVIAFYKSSDNLTDYKQVGENKTDYFISICGDYWLKADIKRGYAFGSVTDSQTQIKLTDIKLK